MFICYTDVLIFIPIDCFEKKKKTMIYVSNKFSIEYCCGSFNEYVTINHRNYINGKDYRYTYALLLFPTQINNV